MNGPWSHISIARISLSDGVRGMQPEQFVGTISHVIGKGTCMCIVSRHDMAQVDQTAESTRLGRAGGVAVGSSISISK